MAEQYIVKVSLIVKADSPEAAQRMVEDHVQSQIQQWFNERSPDGFPVGTLLYYRIPPGIELGKKEVTA